MADTDVTRIAGNIGAMNALYALNNINKQLSIHQTRLATGKRINSAADDPAGLAISTKMLSRSLSLKTALSNIGDAKNLLAVAESGLGRLTDILNSMRTITEQAASDTLGTEERAIVKEQLASYATQINDIVDQTKWSDKLLIDGSYDDDKLTFQTGADVGETTELTGLLNMNADALNLLRDASEAVLATVNTTSIGADLTAAISSVTTTELATGTYTVQTAFQADGTFVMSLVNASSAVVATAGGDYADGDREVVFGNGVTVSLADTGVYVAASESSLATSIEDTGLTMSTSAVAADTDEALDGEYTVSIDIAINGDYTATLHPTAVGGVDIVTSGNYDDGLTDISFGNGITASIAAAFDHDPATTLESTFTYTASVTEGYSADTGTLGYTSALAEGSVNIGRAEDASAFSAFMTIIDNAMVSVNSQLSKIGSLTGSLTFKEDQIASSQINVEASYNRIMNANMAEEQVNASKLLILQQTSTAMLAQANAAPQFLLSLFQ